jgi:hypothetical protein
MYRQFARLVLVWFGVSAVALQGQEFEVFRRTVQVHGFVSQGVVYTNDNNWLTMNTTSGSAAMTDMGLNASVPVTDKLRIGAQVYDRNLGELGQWHPSLDWAVADYRFQDWLGFRGGKVKTIAGLYTDTQDLDFLRPFALLPQSVYPIDLRDATIGHLGGDAYGQFPLGHKMGSLTYTAFGGHRSDSLHSGYPYLASQWEQVKSMGGLQYGGDLRWTTAVKGLLLGVSRINENLTQEGEATTQVGGMEIQSPVTAHTRKNWINQFYSQYSRGRWRLDGEFRRFYADVSASYLGNPLDSFQDARGWYVAGAYRLAKWLELGSYYSRYTVASSEGGTDASKPGNHVFDKVVAARVDLNRFWNVKIEGHFMDGTGSSGVYPAGFYPQENPNGFHPDTSALVVKTSFAF